ncbi:MAG: hypothetical protein QXI12_11775 [Candidatus Methanomethyliaceae archaeon]
MPVYDQVKQALQDILAPELQALKAEIKRLDERVESLRAELLAEMRRVEGRIDALDEKFTGRINALDEKFEGLKHEVRTVLEIRERLAAVEAKVGITRP